MKKLFVCMVIVLGCSMTTVMAQGPGGGQQMTPEERIAMMKERLKPLGLTEVQTDSAVAVMTDRSFMANMGNFREMAPEERQAKMKEVAEARKKRLVKAGLSEELATKVIETMSMRPGGGRGGGGR
ncbi:MAG: hypothetical protein HYU71_08135 [Bacteroidetes bacterium]|nr:hypothetical protein [Bacteroidota bacterium]